MICSAAVHWAPATARSWAPVYCAPLVHWSPCHLLLWELSCLAGRQTCLQGSQRPKMMFPFLGKAERLDSTTFNYFQLINFKDLVPNLASMPSTVFLFIAGKPKWSLQLVSRCFKMLWHSHSRFPNDHMFMVCSHIHLLYAAVPSLCNRTKLHTQRAG